MAQCAINLTKGCTARGLTACRLRTFVIRYFYRTTFFSVFIFTDSTNPYFLYYRNSFYYLERKFFCFKIFSGVKPRITATLLYPKVQLFFSSSTDSMKKLPFILLQNNHYLFFLIHNYAMVQHLNYIQSLNLQVLFRLLKLLLYHS